jgi:predicted small lipoprotein YifL
MTRLRLATWLLLGCLLLTLSACGNKGPLVHPQEEKQQKSETATE